MPGLRETAEADLEYILEDGVMGFGWPITLQNPAGDTESFTGYSGDISQVFDPDTGLPVSGRLAHCTIRLSSLYAKNFEIPKNVPDGSSKPWLVTFNDVNGNSCTFKVSSGDPDRTLGVVVCILEFWEPAE